jgi:hypothetical protein
MNKTLVDEIIEKQIAKFILSCKVSIYETTSNEERIWVTGVVDLRDINAVSENCENKEPAPGICIITFKSGRSWIIDQHFKDVVNMWLEVIVSNL